MTASPLAPGSSVRRTRRAVGRSGAFAAPLFAFGVALFTPSFAQAEGCPDGFPHDCGNGTCAADADACVDPGCADGFPHDCGNGTCASDANACVDPDCPEGYPHDCGDGTCSSTVEDCSGGSTTPGGNGIIDPTCEAQSAVPEGCVSVDACSDGTQAWYVTDDGTKFFCASTTDCAAAGDEVARHCDDQGGCAASAGPASGSMSGLAPMLAFGIAAAARSASRRRSAGTPFPGMRK